MRVFLVSHLQCDIRGIRFGAEKPQRRCKNTNSSLNVSTATYFAQKLQRRGYLLARV
jgi:hypothetical protein